MSDAAEMVAALNQPASPTDSNQYDKIIRSAIEHPEGTTSRRKELQQALEDAGHPVAELLKKQTPEQEAWGDMISDLAIEGSKGYARIDEIFRKFEGRWLDGKTLTNQEKITAFMHAVGFLGCGDKEYRLVRKIFVNSIQEV